MKKAFAVKICNECQQPLPTDFHHSIRYCSARCKAEYGKRRGRISARNHYVVKRATSCKRCARLLSIAVNYRTTVCDNCRIEINRIRARLFQLTPKGKLYVKNASKKRRLRHPERVREIQRKCDRKIRAEQKAGLRPKKIEQKSPLNSLKTRWKKELLKWEPELRQGRLGLAEIRKRLRIGKPLKHPEVWQSLIEALKREAILPT